MVQLTNSNEDVTKVYQYDVFGIEKDKDASDNNPFRYCGEYYDKETGTIYLRARYYNPSTGRLVSQDSIAGKAKDPLSLNLYTYGHSNPVRFIDPSGHIKMNASQHDQNPRYAAVFAAKGGKTTFEDLRAWDKRLINMYGSGTISGARRFDNVTLTKEENMLIAVVYAEMGAERIVDKDGIITNVPNTTAWEAITYIIMSRLDRKLDGWINANSVIDIITSPGAFSGYNDTNYKQAMSYLDNRDLSNSKIEHMITVILPIYLGENTNDFTNGAILYYSPESMIPKDSEPSWNFDELKEIHIEGVPKSSLRVYDYINK